MTAPLTPEQEREARERTGCTRLILPTDRPKEPCGTCRGCLLAAALATIDAARELIGQYDRDYRAQNDAIVRQSAEIAAARADTARLREALVKYGGHLIRCARWEIVASDEPPQLCDCGFDAARAPEAP